MQALATGFIGKATTVQILSRQWRDAVEQAHAEVTESTYRLNPLALEVMALWERDYGSVYFLQVESEEFMKRLPDELSIFEITQKECASKARASLMKEWLLLVLDKLKYAIPKPTMEMMGFYQAMAVLMSNQIRKLAEDSIVSFAKCFGQYAEGSSYDWKPAVERPAGETPKISFDDLTLTVKPVPHKKLRQFFGKIRLSSQKTSSENKSPPFYITLKNDFGVYRYLDVNKITHKQISYQFRKAQLSFLVSGKNCNIDLPKNQSKSPHDLSSHE